LDGYVKSIINQNILKFYFLDLLMERGYPVMLVGGAGSGKLIKLSKEIF
jgi:hypothetical protein